MLRTLITAAAISALLSGSAWAEDITGNWKTEAGDTAEISGSGTYTITLKTGKYAGTRIGTFSGSNGKFKGKITKPSTGDTYSGTARVSGKTLKMTGCVALVLCDSQIWNKL